MSTTVFAVLAVVFGLLAVSAAVGLTEYAARGKRMPSLLVIKKLAAALDTTMASLMEELERDPQREGTTASQPSAQAKKTTRKRSS